MTKTTIKDLIAKRITWRKDVNGNWCGTIEADDGYKFSVSDPAPQRTAKANIKARLIEIALHENQGHKFSFEEVADDKGTTETSDTADELLED